MSDVEVGPPIVKAASNQRSYKLIKLRNGLAALLIHDPEVSLDEEAEAEDDIDDMEVDAGCPSEQPEGQNWSSDFQNNCRGKIHLSIPFCSHFGRFVGSSTFLFFFLYPLCSPDLFCRCVSYLQVQSHPDFCSRLQNLGSRYIEEFPWTL